MDNYLKEIIRISRNNFDFIIWIFVYINIGSFYVIKNLNTCFNVLNRKIFDKRDYSNGKYPPLAILRYWVKVTKKAKEVETPRKG